MVFNDMIADIEVSKKIKSHRQSIISKGKKTHFTNQHIICFYLSILFQSD